MAVGGRTLTSDNERSGHGIGVVSDLHPNNSTILEHRSDNFRYGLHWIFLRVWNIESCPKG